MRSQWSYKGTDLDIIEVPIATERCTDCRQKECIKEAERMAGLNSTHPPAAIVGRWETPCFGQEPSTITLMSFVRVADANLEDSGDYVVQFTQIITEFRQEYHVTVGELLHASLVSTLVAHNEYCSVGIMNRMELLYIIAYIFTVKSNML